MKLYICNKIGQRDTCQISCIHGEPHELIDEEGEKCNHPGECDGWNQKGKYNKIKVKCKLVK